MKDRIKVCLILFMSALIISVIALDINAESEIEEFMQLAPEEDRIIPEEGVAQEEVILQQEIMPGNITIDFKGADIRTVLRILSEKSGVNIVAGKDVEGSVTVRLVNVPWDKALDIICKNYGYAYERVENIIRVTTLENLRQEELTTEVFALNYADASEVAESIREMLTERGKDKIKYDTRTNVLIVTDVPTSIYQVRRVVQRLDKKTPQVLIEAKIIETTLDDDENLGIDWSVKFRAAGAARPMTFPFETIGSRILGRLEMGDMLPTGIGTGSSTVAATATTTTTGAAEFPAAAGNLSSMPLATVDMFTMGTLDFSEFSAVLEFLKSRRDTNVIASPRIATLNNEEAKIFVGRVYNYPIFKETKETGRWVISGFAQKELGIKLLVTPQINENGEIVVKLNPEVGNWLGMQKITDEISAPLWATRDAETQVMIKSGETIMIGGLIKETTVDYKKKIPFLGDIPFIGPIAFTKTEEGVDKTELVIFMTVSLIGTPLMEGGVPPSAAHIPLREETSKR